MAAARAVNLTSWYMVSENWSLGDTPVGQEPDRGAESRRNTERGRHSRENTPPSSRVAYRARVSMSTESRRNRTDPSALHTFTPPECSEASGTFAPSPFHD